MSLESPALLIYLIEIAYRFSTHERRAQIPLFGMQFRLIRRLRPVGPPDGGEDFASFRAL